jgi:hypothetical protein
MRKRTDREAGRTETEVSRTGTEIVLDPTYTMMKQGIDGLRLVDGVYERWEAETDGRRYSRQLPLAFALDGARARVFLREGHAMLREEEVADLSVNLAQKDGALAREREARAKERAELERLRRLLGEQR